MSGHADRTGDLFGITPRCPAEWSEREEAFWPIDCFFDAISVFAIGLTRSSTRSGGCYEGCVLMDVLRLKSLNDVLKFRPTDAEPSFK